MKPRIFLWLSLLMPLLWSGTGNHAEACFACWAGYGPGEERLNKPLADLRIVYEAKGRDSLPYIRQALTTSTDPLVIKRAAGYIVDQNFWTRNTRLPRPPFRGPYPGKIRSV